jgi:hypothetical protein
MKTHFLAAEETRTCRNNKTLRRTVGQRNPFAMPMGAAEKYPAAMTCASRVLVCEGPAEVDCGRASPD